MPVSQVEKSAARSIVDKAGEMLVPGFKDAALNIKKGDNTVIIRMQRLGS